MFFYPVFTHFAAKIPEIEKNLDKPFWKMVHYK